MTPATAWFMSGACFGALVTLLVVIRITRKLGRATARKLEARAFRRAGRLTLAHQESAEGRHAAFRLLRIADEIERRPHGKTPVL